MIERSDGAILAARDQRAKEATRPPDEWEAREEDRFINDLIDEDPDFWRDSMGLKRRRIPACPVDAAIEAMDKEKR